MPTLDAVTRGLQQVQDGCKRAVLWPSLPGTTVRIAAREEIGGHGEHVLPAIN